MRGEEGRLAGGLATPVSGQYLVEFRKELDEPILPYFGRFINIVGHIRSALAWQSPPTGMPEEQLLCDEQSNHL